EAQCREHAKVDAQRTGIRTGVGRDLFGGLRARADRGKGAHLIRHRYHREAEQRQPGVPDDAIVRGDGPDAHRLLSDAVSFRTTPRWTPSARASTPVSAAISSVVFERAPIAAKVPTSSATDTTGKRNIASQVSQTMRSSVVTGRMLIGSCAARFPSGTARR